MCSKWEHSGLAKPSIFPGDSDSKESACNLGDLGSVPGSERSLEGGNGNPLQYSYFGNLMGRGGWRITVKRVTENRT